MLTTTRKQSRTGFTLIELLVVIAIIGLLAGMILPAVMGAVKTARETAYKLEVDTLAEAVEKYRSKYGDYPPDGHSWSTFERHIRKAFPQILQSEIDLMNPTTTTALNSQGWGSDSWTLLNNATYVAGVRNDFDTNVFVGGSSPYVAADLKVMDPAEALVFFLGGFSADPQRPFTGVGGPFIDFGATSPGQRYGVNLQRENSLFEFATGRLTVLQFTSGSNVGNISNDESEYYNGTNDLLPVYVGSNALLGVDAPFVYFDSRNYVSTKGGGYISFYQPSPLSTTTVDPRAKTGAVRPVVSDTLRSPAGTGTRRNLFMEDKKFQVIGPGVDGSYGGLINTEALAIASDIDELAAALFFTLPTGDSYQINATRDPDNSTPAFPFWYSRLILLSSNAIAPELKARSLSLLDNAANFSGRTFQGSVGVTAP